MRHWGRTAPARLRRRSTAPAPVVAIGDDLRRLEDGNVLSSQPLQLGQRHAARTTIHVTGCWTIPKPVSRKWGSFDTFDEAYSWAKECNDHPVNLCGTCNPERLLR